MRSESATGFRGMKTLEQIADREEAFLEYLSKQLEAPSATLLVDTSRLVPLGGILRPLRQGAT